MARRQKLIIGFCSALLFVLAALFWLHHSLTSKPLISLFPLEHYDQKISTWINPADANYNQILLSPDMQRSHFSTFFKHYFGSLSPWSPSYIQRLIQQKSLEEIINPLPKPNRYGENFRPHTQEWMNAITQNIDINQFDHLQYQANHRGIAVTNLAVRALPTDEVSFYHHTVAGQGYPFDNLQMSALWVGTPVYILGQTQDHAWELVVTPDLIGWVHSTGIGLADEAFIQAWQAAAQKQLAAITRTQTSVMTQQGKFLFSAYIGTIFPIDVSTQKIWIPVMGSTQQAGIEQTTLPAKDYVLMPITVTPHHFATIIASLVGRPYGWGNEYFYNDCSGELKNLFTPFGIWLPRHSREQVNSGAMIDLSAESAKKRVEYLKQHGKPWLTIGYNGEHVFLYIGNYLNQQHEPTAMTYQNVWGLSPMNPPMRRAVIGGAVFLPLLVQYPDAKELRTHANADVFQIRNLAAP